MAAKGTVSKNEIFAKMMEVFPESFMYNEGKELRINWKEDGAPIQIKATLTAAKVPVEASAADIQKSKAVKIAPSGALHFGSTDDDDNNSTDNWNDAAMPAPVPTVNGSTDSLTPEEKKNISVLVKQLGLQ